MNNETLLTLTADIVSAHVSNNSVALTDVASLVAGVHQSLASLGKAIDVVPPVKVPVVSIKASIKPDYIVCLECGKKQKMLKRHLLTAHKETPEEYRIAFGLPASYPMVANNYSDRRRELAKSFGLGRKPGQRAKSSVSLETNGVKGRRRSAKPSPEAETAVEAE
jgi:predicted transcriptional regulator